MLGIAASAALVASSTLHSPAAALLASLVAVIAWRAGARPGALLALLAAAATLRFDPFLTHAAAGASLLAIGALFAAALLGAIAARRLRPPRAAHGGGGARDTTHPGERSAGGASRRSPRITPYTGMRAVTGEARRFVSSEESASDRGVEQEVVERFLLGMLDALGGDAVVLWGRTPWDDELTTLAAATRGAPLPAIATNPSPESLAHWALQQGVLASNYDTDESLLMTARVGKSEPFHGAVGVYAIDRRNISRERAKTTLPRYAARLALVLDALRDGRETRRYRGKAEILAKAAERVQSRSDLAGLARAICEAAIEVSGATRAAFAVWDEAGRTGRLVSVSPGHPVPQGFAVAEDSFVGVACRDSQRFTIRESYYMSELPMYGAGEPSRRVSSIAIVPLQHDDHTLGAIAVEGDEQAQLTSVEGSLLSLLASVAGVAMANVRQLEEVTARSITDELTGLPNRRVFDERLRQHLAECDRFNQVLSLVLIDVDHFKAVNDTYGHAAGDAVLVALATAIANDVRNIDLCARYGGEELAILLPQTGLDAARDVAERLRSTAEELVVVAAGEPIGVTVSVGVACYPHSTGSQDALFSVADQALYAAKHGGRNCVMLAPATARATTV